MAKKKVYIVVYPILENGKTFNPGAKYDGPNAQRFLRDGQIKEK